MPICPHDGHYDGEPQGAYCATHGVPWFVNCPSCGAEWTTGRTSRQNYLQVAGDDYCAGCAMPGPWLERPQLMEWVRSNVKASTEIPASEHLELLKVLSKLEAMDANDTKTVRGWEEVRKLAPKVWEKTKPVRDALIGEAVKKALETLGS
jgi:hypothetical protein